MSSYREHRIDIAEFTPDLRYELPLAIDDMSLAHHLGIRNRTLWWAVHNKPKLYKVFQLPKRGKNGGYRQIQNPADRLKDIQKNLLVRFLEPVTKIGRASCRDRVYRLV
jgi:hypothetical protein